MTGAMPSSVCERRAFVGLMSGVAVADVAASTAGGADAASGDDDGRGIGVGRRAPGLADGRGAGVEALGAGTEALGAGTEALGAGTEALGAGTEALGAGTEALGAGTEALGAGTEALGAGVEGEAVVAASVGSGAGAGSSSAPHSASISSVGGATDGTGVLALTRSLSDRLSVIALPSAFHGTQHKSSARVSAPEIGCNFAF
jgi:hypothetical protein